MEFRWSHFAKEIILWGVRWYVATPISYRQLEEMMKERAELGKKEFEKNLPAWNVEIDLLFRRVHGCVAAVKANDLEFKNVIGFRVFISVVLGRGIFFIR